MTSVLVTDAEQRSTLAAVRSLGRAGHQVVVCSAHPTPLAGASKHCDRAYQVPDPGLRPADFQSAVLDAAYDSGSRVILPMTDVSAPLVMGLRDRDPSLVVPYPELQEYLAVSNKRDLTEEAIRLGIPVPEQCVVESPDEVDSAAIESLGFPLFLKPARSAVDTDDGTIRLAVRMVSDPDDLSGALADFPRESYPILAQRRVVGPGLGIFLVSWDGRTVASFAHRRLREKPPTGGVSVYRESVPVRADLLEYSERLLAHYGWRGAAMIEFKEDSETGIPYLMEINGRFWGSLQLAIDAGVDFPNLLVRAAGGEVVNPVTDYRSGVRSRWLWGDIDHLIWMLKTPSRIRRSSPHLSGRIPAILRFLVPWRPGDRFEVLRLGDPRPFVRESIEWFRALGGSR